MGDHDMFYSVILVPMMLAVVVMVFAIASPPQESVPAAVSVAEVLREVAR